MLYRDLSLWGLGLTGGSTVATATASNFGPTATLVTAVVGLAATIGFLARAWVRMAERHEKQLRERIKELEEQLKERQHKP